MKHVPLIMGFLWLLGGMACQSGKAVPAGIIPPPKMREVMRDLMRADQFVVSFVLPKDSLLPKQEERIKWYNRVLDIHHVSEQQFKKSFQYYQSRPELMAEMMDSISRQEDEIDIVVPRRKPLQVAE